MKYFLKLLFIVFAISIASCSNTTINVDNAWEQMTIQKILNSKNVDGGYTILNDEREASLYDTRFALELFIEAKQNIPKKRELEKYIKALQSENITLNNEDDLVRLKHIVDISSILKIGFDKKFKESLKDKLFDLKTKEDLFAFSSKDQLLDKISVTETTVHILKKLDIDYNATLLQQTLLRILENNDIENIDSHYKPTIYNSVLNVLNETGYVNFKDVNIINKLKNNTLMGSFNIPKSKTEIYNVIANIDILKKLGIQPVIPQELINYLEKIRLKDGGFNFIMDDVADLQATLEVNKIYYKKEYLDQLLENIKKFQLDNGVFAIRSHINSSFNRTIIANNVLFELGYDSQEDLKKFMATNRPQTSKDLFLLKEYNEDLFNQYKFTIKNNIVDKFDMDLLYKLALSKASLEEKQIVVDKLIQDPEFWLTLRLEASYLLIKSIKQGEIKYSLDYNKIKSWLNTLKRNDGGISNNPNSSNLIETYYALLIMKLLDVNPDKKAVESYINSLKVSSGGFSFVKNGKADLLATFYALRCKKILKLEE
jgi:hypothetical protein